MKVYIASSWKNQHAVEMLTYFLRKDGHEVLSFVENNFNENPNSSINEKTKKFNFDEWLRTDDANKSFEYDVAGATKSDLVIYIAPSGKDACFEAGLACASGITVLGLFAKGEDLGLMRKAIKWFDSHIELLIYIENELNAQTS